VKKAAKEEARRAREQKKQLKEEKQKKAQKVRRPFPQSRPLRRSRENVGNCQIGGDVGEFLWQTCSFD
jgi:hypothetical protein